MDNIKIERFKTLMESRIKTTMIGSLSKMEQNFGYLWGHFKDGPLTEQQEKFADLWDYTRNQILNQGNKQIRQMKEDLDKQSDTIKCSIKQKLYFKHQDDQER
jgi:hypothetical protein